MTFRSLKNALNVEKEVKRKKEVLGNRKCILGKQGVKVGLTSPVIPRKQFSWPVVSDIITHIEFGE